MISLQDTDFILEYARILLESLTFTALLVLIAYEWKRSGIELLQETKGRRTSTATTKKKKKTPIFIQMVIFEIRCEFGT